jgi:hypothetical protein
MRARRHKKSEKVKLERRPGIPQQGGNGALLLRRAMRRAQKAVHVRVDEKPRFLRRQVLHPMRRRQRAC